ncbi:hypothetical protein Prudu_019503, partial [Prunus dulcis]
ARRKESVDTEWARIGVVTKKFGQKSLSGITVNISKFHLYKPDSARNGPPTSRRCWRRLRAPMATTGGVGTAIESPTFPTDINPGAALSWPENRVFRRRFVRSYRTSSLKFFLVSPPNRSSKASEVQPISMRKLQRVVEVHRIHHRATLNLHASKSGEILGLVKIQGRLCQIFGRSLREF